MMQDSLIIHCNESIKQTYPHKIARALPGARSRIIYFKIIVICIKPSLHYAEWEDRGVSDAKVVHQTSRD